MPRWSLDVDIDDYAAIAIGRTVHPLGDNATPEQCRQAFGSALHQFVARAVAERYAQALADRATARANDLASAVIITFPDGYDPQVTQTPLNTPPGPGADFTHGPAADPANDQTPSAFTADAGFASEGVTTADATASG